MRRRLRPAWTPDELAELYAVPHDHTRWDDHIERIKVTVAAAMDAVQQFGPFSSAADLSCGSGAVLEAVPLAARFNGEPVRRVFGDYAPGRDVTGPLEETLEQIDPVGLYICTETLEHVDDPDLVLRQIRAKAKVLLLSTPVDAWDDPNPEHYWAWSRHDVERMAELAGWTVATYEDLDFTARGPQYYRFGIWVMR